MTNNTAKIIKIIYVSITGNDLILLLRLYVKYLLYIYDVC